jgi:Phage portal protein, SPP1 Gp6-like
MTMPAPAFAGAQLAAAGVPARASSQNIPDITQRILRMTQGERNRLNKINRYMRDRPDGVYVPRSAREEYRWLVKRSKVNFLPLIVSVVAQNLHIDGYRTSPDADIEDDYTAAKALDDAQMALSLGDVSAAHQIISDAAAKPATATPATDNGPWNILVANRFGSRQHGLWRSVAKFGLGYALIMPGEPQPVVTMMSPRRLTALYEDTVMDEWPMYAVEQFMVNSPAGRYKIVRLYDNQYRYTMKSKNGTDSLSWIGADDPLLPTGTTTIQEHDLGECPVVRFAHEIDLDGELDVMGEVEPLIPLQDQINTTTFNMLMAQQYGAFRQRWVTGMVPDDEDGRPKEPFRSGVDRLFVAEDPTTKFGEFSQTALGDFLNAREASIRHASTISQVPPYAVMGQITNLSAEALAAVRDGLDRKVEELQGTLSEPAKQMIQMACHAAGDEKNAEDYAGVIAWRDTGARAFAATVDALGKLSQMLGVPATELWAKVPGVTQDDVERWKAAVEKPGVLEQLATMLAAQQGGGALAQAPGQMVTDQEPYAPDAPKPGGF